MRIVGRRGGGLGPAGDLQGLGAGDLGAGAMADGRHALSPGLQPLQSGGQPGVGLRQGAPQPPDVHPGRGVRQAGLVPRQEGRLAQGLVEPGGVAPPLDLHGPGGLGHGLDVEGATGQLLAVGDEGLGGQMSHLAEDDRHSRLEEQPVGPQADRPQARQALVARKGRSALEFIEYGEGVAVDIRADLHDRRPPVAAGQRRQVRLGHHVRGQDRRPGLAGHAEDNPHLLREGRGVVVMQDQVHLTLPGPV